MSQMFTDVESVASMTTHKHFQGTIVMRWICMSLLMISMLRVVCGEDFPQPHNSEQGNPQPISPAEALAKVELPPGFKATMFAAEPDVQNPIAMTFDARDRLWIAENNTYAERSQRFDLNLRDRIVILHDADRDGKAESRKVFTDKLQMLTSVEVGYGGVWAMCPPYLMFIPDKNGDDVPDGPPEIKLDGFTVAQENYHNFANGLRWGPDGWLYGRCGASCPGEIGVPGIKAEDRVPLRGGIWRYHPQRKMVEVLCHGTTNPWGHDWDEHGEMFFTNTVNGHLWHMIPGAHYTRPHTVDPHPHVYELLDFHADHWHFDTGKSWTASRDGAANAYGGGHAHCGALIYKGHNWPEAYRGKLLTLNLHGRRINVERLERHGSGYIARHEPDMVMFGDPWFRGMDLREDSQGMVYVIDWSDTGECHDHTGVHRTSGRIYRISYHGERPEFKPSEFDKWNEFERRKLHERFLKGEDVEQEKKQLMDQLIKPILTRQKLQALWALNLLDYQLEFINSEPPNKNGDTLKAWMIRTLSDYYGDNKEFSYIDRVDGLIREASPETELFKETKTLLDSSTSPYLRLVAASQLSRMRAEFRAEIASELARNVDDANDHNLPLLVWYGLASLPNEELSNLNMVIENCAWPNLRRHIARRLSLEIEKNPKLVESLLEIAVKKTPEFQADVLQGMTEGLAGMHKATKPASWDAFVKAIETDEKLKAKAQELSVLFGDGRALEEVKKVVLNDKLDMNARKSALQSLIDARAPDLKPLCEKLIGTRFLNTTAIKGLALENDAAVGETLVKSYRSFWAPDRPQVVAVLVTRAAWAEKLLDAIAAGKIPRDDLNAFQARQIHAHQSAALTEKLSSVWGEIHDSSTDKIALKTKLKTELTPEALKSGNASQGRMLFVKTCATCHTLYGEGGKRGPDITGAQRQNLDYLLENIVEPSAVVPADYRMQQLELKDGRVISGVITAKTDRTVTVITPTETLTLANDDIEAKHPTKLSLMPDGLLQTLSPEQTRDLFAYLMSLEQAPLPAGAEQTK
jgi:putative membrane-bound dehydrogenase-like protein